MAAAWSALDKHFEQVKDRPLISLFEQPDRADAFSIRLAKGADPKAGLLFDYSKTNLDDTGRELLLNLARAAGLEARREQMFIGARINRTEGRAVLHTALRGTPDPSLPQAVRREIETAHDHMRRLSQEIRDGRFAGAGGPFTDVVNIGIGGSDLGPVMATGALSPYHDGPRAHFLSNIDGAAVHDLLCKLDPKTTLVVIVSKTFTTSETMTNAQTLRNWLALAVDEPGEQMVGVTSAPDQARKWNIPEDRVIGFGDYVGGRFSIWGPVGLTLMIAIGPDDFDAFREGGAEMDSHFRQAPLEQNMPVMLGLIGIWHNQICGYTTRAVLPYCQRLARLPAYLQQLEMESNGKRVSMQGEPLDHHSGPVVWGEAGTNGQHAFYQLIHQGTRIVPCEFLVAASGHEPELAHQHKMLVANCLAQSEALMLGRSLETARAMMVARGFAGAELEVQAKQREFPGNRPSTTLAYPKLTPFQLGQIIALYEHRVFVEGVVLGINSFDQWGVELGKELALQIAPLLGENATDQFKDGSTRLLLAHLRQAE